MQFSKHQCFQKPRLLSSSWKESRHHDWIRSSALSGWASVMEHRSSWRLSGTRVFFRHYSFVAWVRASGRSRVAGNSIMHKLFRIYNKQQARIHKLRSQNQMLQQISRLQFQVTSNQKAPQNQKAREAPQNMKASCLKFLWSYKKNQQWVSKE